MMFPSVLKGDRLQLYDSFHSKEVVFCWIIILLRARANEVLQVENI